MFASDDKQGSAFEEHIQSDGFDVSQLNAPNHHVHVRERISTLLNSLPQPLDYRLYEEELDEMQKQLCAYLAEAVADRYIKPTIAEQAPREVTDDDLHMIVTITMAMAMITQQRLHVPMDGKPLRPSLRPIMPVDVPPPPPMTALSVRAVPAPTLWRRIKRTLARWILRLLRRD